MPEYEIIEKRSSAPHSMQFKDFGEFIEYMIENNLFSTPEDECTRRRNDLQQEIENFQESLEDEDLEAEDYFYFAYQIGLSICLNQNQDLVEKGITALSQNKNDLIQGVCQYILESNIAKSIDSTYQQCSSAQSSRESLELDHAESKLISLSINIKRSILAIHFCKNLNCENHIIKEAEIFIQKSYLKIYDLGGFKNVLPNQD